MVSIIASLNINWCSKPRNEIWQTNRVWSVYQFLHPGGSHVLQNWMLSKFWLFFRILYNIMFQPHVLYSMFCKIVKLFEPHMFCILFFCKILKLISFCNDYCWLCVRNFNEGFNGKYNSSHPKNSFSRIFDILSTIIFFIINYDLNVETHKIYVFNKKVIE